MSSRCWSQLLEGLKYTTGREKNILSATAPLCGVILQPDKRRAALLSVPFQTCQKEVFWVVLCWRQAGKVHSPAPCLCWWFGVTLLRMWCVFGGILRAALQVVDYIAAALHGHVPVSVRAQQPAGHQGFPTISSALFQ